MNPRPASTTHYPFRQSSGIYKRRVSASVYKGARNTSELFRLIVHRRAEGLLGLFRSYMQTKGTLDLYTFPSAYVHVRVSAYSLINPPPREPIE